MDCQALSCRNDETITFSATINYQQRQGPSEEASQSTVIGQEGGGIIGVLPVQDTQDPCFIPGTPTRIFTELVTDEEFPVNGAIHTASQGRNKRGSLKENSLFLYILIKIITNDNFKYFLKEKTP